MSNIPTQQDLSVENSKDLGDLHLGDVHLHNFFAGKEFTLKRAKEWWKRQHDPLHVLLKIISFLLKELEYVQVRRSLLQCQTGHRICMCDTFKPSRHLIFF